MKRREKWTDKRVEKQLDQFPDVKDHRSKAEIFHKVQQRTDEKQKSRRKQRFPWLIPSLAATAAVILGIIIVPGMIPEQDEINNDQLMTMDVEEESEQSEVSEETGEVNETVEEDIDMGIQTERVQEKEVDDVMQVLDEYESIFMDIVDRAGEDGKVASFESKDDLLSHFTTVMSEDLAKSHVDMYFQEDGDELYILAMDAPIWLNEEEPYDVEEVSTEEYHVIQEHDNEMFGHVNIIYVLTFDGDNWVVDEIKQDELG
ncbi:hypothetical protein [Texcoconibacillus texcoconensis]|uniref:Uncharacterized protein n=1 Tax=Texcoconibacillus texcoconensis TaxID=1095777 RepID=A0A840QSI8_9BACI|nr:hypothetical protein [Texcoconibacillus texcoconensis]MBB5174237.1 hypothetical protein [Texcoconibacillus texcoconensis]